MNTRKTAVKKPKDQQQDTLTLVPEAAPVAAVAPEAKASPVNQRPRFTIDFEALKLQAEKPKEYAEICVNKTCVGDGSKRVGDEVCAACASKFWFAKTLVRDWRRRMAMGEEKFMPMFRTAKTMMTEEPECQGMDPQDIAAIMAVMNQYMVPETETVTTEAELAQYDKDVKEQLENLKTAARFAAMKIKEEKAAAEKRVRELKAKEAAKKLVFDNGKSLVAKMYPAGEAKEGKIVGSVKIDLDKAVAMLHAELNPGLELTEARTKFYQAMVNSVIADRVKLAKDVSANYMAEVKKNLAAKYSTAPKQTQGAGPGAGLGLGDEGKTARVRAKKVTEKKDAPRPEAKKPAKKTPKVKGGGGARGRQVATDGDD